LEKDFRDLFFKAYRSFFGAHQIPQAAGLRFSARRRPSLLPQRFTLQSLSVAQPDNARLVQLDSPLFQPENGGRMARDY